MRVGSYQSPSCFQRSPPRTIRSAGSPRPLHEALHPGQVIGVDQRADRGLRAPTVTEHVLVGEPVEQLEEVARHRSLHDEACTGEAYLARIVVLEGGLPRRRLEIGVGEDEKRSLSPNSAVKGTMLRAAATPMWRAVSGEPVKEMRLTRRSDTRAAPTSSPIPWTKLNTPGGSPASSTRSARTEAESGAHSAGLRITVLPAARAGASFQVERIQGAFQGVMITAGPAGILCTWLSVPFEDQVRPW